METSHRVKICFIFFVVWITLCLFLIALLSGYGHEYNKFRQYMFSFISNTMLRFILFEHIAIPIQVLIKTANAWKKRRKRPKLKSARELMEANNWQPYKAIDFMKLHLESLKAQMYLSKCHKDENLNRTYQVLTQEIWLFGKYFLLVLLIVAYSRNSYAYYNTNTMRAILNNSYFSNYSLESIHTIKNFYSWVNDTLVVALNEGKSYDGSTIEEPGWIHFHIAKLVGVVRLQQVRHEKKIHGMVKLYLDEKDYLPQWKNLTYNMHYVDKFWRTYNPWLSKKYHSIASWLMPYNHIDSLYSFPENNGYVALLARNRRNSEKIVKFLKKNVWLDAQTAAVFIDFTLYNVDANMFTMCSILVEQTPFGNLVWQINVQSAELLTNFSEFSIWRWVLFLIYILQSIQLSKVLIIKAWFLPGFFKSRWNCVDLSIILLNLVAFSFKMFREYNVSHLLKASDLSQKLEYVDFRVASLFDYMAIITLGFLVFLLSVRIWKILQFSSIFRIFNRTLYTSAGALFATVVGIHVFLFAIGLSAQIVNGSHTEIFSRYLKSVTSIMSFSFGFNSRTSPDDLSHGGGVLGFILYLILMFVVAIFLVNMFITLICEHFASARAERDKQTSHQLSYWQFLKMEYSFIAEFYRKLFPRYYKRQNQTVSENIENKLNDLEMQLSLNQEEAPIKPVLPEPTDDQLHEEDLLAAQHIDNVSEVLLLQMEILQRHLTLQFIENDSVAELSDDEEL